MRRLAFGTFLLAAALIGCGESGPVAMRISGEATYDGKPIDDGKITLTPTGTTPGGSFAGAIKAGKYDIPRSEGPFAKGTYKVEISSLSKQGKALPNVVDPGGPSLAVYEELIPKAYNSESTLSLTVSEDSSKNTHDFKLAKVGR